RTTPLKVRPNLSVCTRLHDRFDAKDCARVQCAVMREPDPLLSLGLSPKTSPAPAGAPASANAELQFHTAEYAGSDNLPKCGMCRVAMADSYFRVADKQVCKACTAVLRARMAPVTGLDFGKCLLYGAGAALAGAVIYGIVLLAIGQLALVSIMIGIMV